MELPLVTHQFFTVFELCTANHAERGKGLRVQVRHVELQRVLVGERLLTALAQQLERRVGRLWTLLEDVTCTAERGEGQEWGRRGAW